jgi:hypothetical protein
MGVFRINLETLRIITTIQKSGHRFSGRYSEYVPYQCHITSTRKEKDDQAIRVRSPAGVKDYSLLHNVQTESETHSACIQWVPGTPSPGVKRKANKADHSPSSNAEVKNGGATFSLSHTY